MNSPTTSVDVRPTTVIQRTPAEVAEFMFDPANDLAWTGGITSSRPEQPGPLREGHSVVRTARFLGRTFDYGYVVTAHQEDRLVEMKVDRPFPMVVRYELTPSTTAPPRWRSGRPATPAGSSAGPGH